METSGIYVQANAKPTCLTLVKFIAMKCNFFRHISNMEWKICSKVRLYTNRGACRIRKHWKHLSTLVRKWRRMSTSTANTQYKYTNTNLQILVSFDMPLDKNHLTETDANLYIGHWTPTLIINVNVGTDATKNHNAS